MSDYDIATLEINYLYILYGPSFCLCYHEGMIWTNYWDCCNSLRKQNNKVNELSVNSIVASNFQCGRLNKKKM